MDDVLSIFAGSVVTHCLRLTARVCLQRNVPKWQQLEQKSQERLAVEVATIPARVFLGWLIWPIVWDAFTPLGSWHAKQTEHCLLAWSVNDVHLLIIAVV